MATTILNTLADFVRNCNAMAVIGALHVLEEITYNLLIATKEEGARRYRSNELHTGADTFIPGNMSAFLRSV